MAAATHRNAVFKIAGSKKSMGWGIALNAMPTAVRCMYKHNDVSMVHRGLLEGLKTVYLFKHFATEINSYSSFPNSILFFTIDENPAVLLSWTKANKMPLT